MTTYSDAEIGAGMTTSDDALNSIIATNVRAARTAANITQRQLAEHAAAALTGVQWTERLIARIESGSRPLRLSEAVAIAAAAGVTVEFLTDADVTRHLLEQQVRGTQSALESATEAHQAAVAALAAINKTQSALEEVSA